MNIRPTPTTPSVYSRQTDTTAKPPSHRAPPVTPPRHKDVSSFDTPSPEATNADSPPPLYLRRKQSIEASKLRLEILRGKYPEGAQYEEEMARELDEYEHFIKNLPADIPKEKEENLIATVRTATKRAMTSITGKLTEIYQQLDQAERALTLSIEMTSPPKESSPVLTSKKNSRSITSLRSFSNKFTYAGRTRDKRALTTSSSTGSIASEEEESLHSARSEASKLFNNKKNFALGDFQNAVQDKILPENEGKIAHAVMKCISAPRKLYESMAIKSHPLYTHFLQHVISDKAKEDFTKLAEILEGISTKTRDAESAAVEVHTEFREPVNELANIISEREKSLNAYVENFEGNAAALLKDLNDRILPLRDEKILLEAQRILKRHCRDEDRPVENTVYEFVESFAPEATTLFNELYKRREAALDKLEKIENDFNELKKISKDDANKLKPLKDLALAHQNGIQQWIHVQNQSSNYTFSKTKRDLDEDLESQEKQTNEAADKLLRDHYKFGINPLKGKALDFVSEHAPAVATAYLNIKSGLVGVDAQINFIKNEYNKTSKETQGVMEGLYRNLIAVHETLQGDMVNSLVPLVDRWKNYSQKGQEKTEERVADAMKQFLISEFPDTIPQGPTYDFVKNIRPKVAVEVYDDAVHKKNMTGPYLFAQPMSDADAEELRKGMYEKITIDDRWKEYTGPVKIEHKAVHTAEDMFSLVRQYAGGRNWRFELAVKLASGALEAAFAKIYLANTESRHEEIYKKTDSYQTALSNLNKKYESNIPTTEMKKMDKIQRKFYNGQIEKFRTYVTEYQELSSDPTIPAEVKESLDKFYNLQIERAQSVFIPPPRRRFF